MRQGWLLLALFVFSMTALGQVVLTPEEQAIANKMVSASGQHRPFLQLDATLTAVARARALDMGRRAYFDHVNPDGHGPNYMVRAAGYPLPAWWGTDPTANYIESIAGGRSTADATWNDWMNSTPHRDHLLANTSFDAANTSYGVGYAKVSGSPFTYYWVVITCPPPPAPKLAITAPAPGAVINTNTATLAGTTSADSGTSSVVWRLENSGGIGAFKAASGVSTWSATTASLVPGLNTFRVRSLNASGGTIMEATVAVSCVILKPLTVSVSGVGSVTSGFLGTSNRELGKIYTITATPGLAAFFSGWTGSVQASTPSVTFTMVEGLSLTANFIPNPFTTHVGNYAGLISGAESGLVRLSVMNTGVFTGSLQYGNAVYPFSGRFPLNGVLYLEVARPGTTPLAVTLRLDLATGSGVTATVHEGLGTSTATATPSFANAGAKFAGAATYTIVIPPSILPGAPQGSGFGRLIVDAQGRARLTATLPDGSAVMTSGAFSANGQFSFYAPMMMGALSGTLTVRPQFGSDIDGPIRWVRPAVPALPVHPTAIDVTSTLLGSVYTRPASGTMPLNLAKSVNNALLTLSAGNLPLQVTQRFTVDTAGRAWITQPVLPRVSVSFNTATGEFLGSFVHPQTGQPTSLRGVILQKQNSGLGYFSGPTATGAARLSAP